MTKTEASFDPPTARFWYELPGLGDFCPGPALSEALLAEEARHGVTLDVAWAYAEAMPALLGPDPMVALLPLAFGRGALRAVALESPLELDGLHHVQTRSPEVCRVMGARVPSFAVRGEECVRALLEHGSAVREVVATHCVPFAVDARFRLVFPAAMDARASRWFESYVADYLMPVVRLDLDVWLCWDRDLARPCVVKGHDTILEGRWGPRDVAPEHAPPAWAEPAAHAIGGERWASTMLRNQSRSIGSTSADPQRGWLRLRVEDDAAYHDALSVAWREGQPLTSLAKPSHGMAWLASLRIDGATAHFSWLGQERVLRLRNGELEQLTTDHDLQYEAAHGGEVISPEALAALGEVPNVVTRSLPTHPRAQGSCDVAAGDRFVLVDRGSHGELERAAGGARAFTERVRAGSPREVARWMRAVLLRAEREQPVLVVDADATIITSGTTPRAMRPPAAARDLVERPTEHHNRRVRFRGVFHRSVEVSVIADAWFRGEVKTPTGAPCPMGTWIVDAEGLWCSDGSEHGHFGQYASELRGTLTLSDLSRARPIAPDRIRFARRYVPLSSEIVIERGLLHWIHEGRRATRLGGDARLPVSGQPERCRVRAKFVVGMYLHLMLLEWEILHTEPLAPERATATAPGHVGRYVEIEGLLVPTDRLPRLDGLLDVTPPSVTLSPELRYVIPNTEAVARFRSILGTGRRVIVRGEVDRESLIRALSISDGAEPLDL